MDKEALKPEDGWQPIETAPMDGTVVLLWEPGRHDPEGRVRLGSYREDDFRGDLGPMWLEDDYDDFSCGMASTPARPTHWIPIPPPPALSQGEESNG